MIREAANLGVHATWRGFRFFALLQLVDVDEIFVSWLGVAL